MINFKKTNLFIVGLISLILAIFFILNYLMNPYGLSGEYQSLINPTKSQSEIYVRIGLSDYTYIKQLKDIINYKPKIIILGSSIENAFTCEGSSRKWFLPDKDWINVDPQIGYNASINGGGLEDAWHYLQHAYQNNPKLEKVILGLDLHLVAACKGNNIFSRISEIIGKTHFPPLAYLKYTVSKLAIEDTAWIIYAKYFDKGADKTFIKYIFEPFNMMLNVLPSFFNTFLNQSDTYAEFTTYEDTSVASIENKNLFQKIVFSRWFVAIFPTNDNDREEDRKDNFDLLRKIIFFCKEKNIKLVPFLSPSSLVGLSILRELGREKKLHDVIKNMTTIIPFFYDFSHLITPKNEDIFFPTDCIHYTHELGKIIFESLLGDSPNAKKMLKKIDQTNVDEFITYQKKMIDEWRKSQPRTQKIIEKYIQSTPYMGAVPQMEEIKIYTPDHKGYKIFSFRNVQYWAIPGIIASPIELSKLMLLEYPNILMAGSLKELIAMIDKSLGFIPKEI